MITTEKLNGAISEARRFIENAEAAMKRLSNDDYAKYGSKETAAARRASMDLTRALAELRK